MYYEEYVRYPYLYKFNGFKISTSETMEEIVRKNHFFKKKNKDILTVFYKFFYVYF